MSLTWLILLAFGWLADLGMPYHVSMLLIFFALIGEHILCRSSDLARINVAFFQMNALVGLFIVVGVGASIYLPRHPVPLMDGHVLVNLGGIRIMSFSPSFPNSIWERNLSAQFYCFKRFLSEYRKGPDQ